MWSPCLAVEGKNVIFSHNGKVPVLEELNIKVKKGHIYGLLGPSGCGKTTLLRCILGRLQPKSGEIRIYGRKPGESGFCIPGRGVGYMPQELALYSEITVEEVLQYFGRLFNMSHDQIRERISFMVDLLKIPNKKSLIKNLSGGEGRRVSFATALIHKPPLLILDEPTVGVDPLLRQSIWTHLKTLATDEHITIIITTHYVEEARHADMVGLMRKGYLLAEENPERLIERHGLNSLEEVFLKLSTDDELCLQRPVCTKIQQIVKYSPLNKSYSSLHASVEEIQSLSNGSFCPNTKSLQTSECNVNSNNDAHNSLTCSEEDVHAVLYHNETKPEQIEKYFQRLKALIKKSFIESKRNIAHTTFQFFIPALQMVLICVCIGQNPFNLPVAVVNMETKVRFSQKFLEKLDNRTIIQVPYSDLSSAINSVKIGESWGVLCIEQNFTSSLIRRFLKCGSVDNGTIWGSSIKLYLDMTNRPIKFTLQHSIFMSFQTFVEEMLITTSQNPMLAKFPIVVEDPVYGSEDAPFVEFMVPNMLLGLNYFIAVALTAMGIILEKRQGLLERSMVAGVQCSQILFTVMLTMFLVLVVQVILVLVVVLYVFEIPIHGSVIWALVCILVAGIGGMSMGLFVSAVSKNENMAVLLVVTIYLTSIVISGLIWPIEAMPLYLRYISYCLPLTLLADAMRSVLLRGWSVTDNYIWIGLVVSLAWIVLFLLLAGLIFKRKR